ncbi:hypothetical protein [Veillonella sp. VA139]|uniref:hypothetical protein n=1 Tax=Veillonella sp. VA139 TaxID=741830 RepID=UPI000F8F1347|nr:hypothetical protein [Veillonella sp. VA139]
MTKSEFINEIVKNGNIIVALGGRGSYLYVYKLMEPYSPNGEQIKADVLYNYGNPSNYKIAFSMSCLINESTNYCNYYIVVEEY